MKTNKYILALALTLCCAVGNLYAVDKSYYNSLDGKSGTALREAMTSLLYDKHTTGLGYNWVFDGIDWDSDGNVYDIYSDCGHTKNDATDQYKCCCDAINREHVVPQSLFGKSAPQVSDRHHLFVVDGKANGYRSDYAFGECSGGTKGTCNNASTVKPSEGKATCTNHEYGKLGTSTFTEVSISDKVYEPGDEYKGDIARAIMYMVIRYATADYCKVKSGSGTSANSSPVTTWSGSSNAGLMFSSSLSTNYGLSAYGKALLMKWHRADPPSAREIARNNGVEAKQGNRNPFIDLPDLAEYLWGTKTSNAVDLSSMTLFTSGSGSGSGGSSAYEITLNRNGATQTVTCTGTYTLPTSSTEVAACANWPFAGWSTTSPVNTTSAPSFTTSVSSATTLYAVYSNTVSSAPIRKAAAKDAVLWSEDWTGSTTATSGNNSATPSSNYGKGTTVYNSGTVTYAQSANSVYVRNESLAGGSTPELMLTSGQTWTISGIPTGDATEMTLTYKSNNTKSSVTCSTANVSISGSSKSYTIDNSTAKASTITLVFSCNGNTRIDDVSLTVATAGSGSGGGSSTTTYYTSATGCDASSSSECTKLTTPVVSATPSDGQIALSWSAVAGATGYTVSISQGAGYTTECGSAVTSPVTVSGTSHTFTGLINGLEYTTSVVANASSSSCNSDADEDTATPMDCNTWDDPTISWNKYSLNTTDNKTATFSVSGTTYGTRSFESSNTDVLTVDNTTGAVTAVAPGSATITVHWTGASGYCEKSVISETFAISGPLTITYNANYGETPATTTQTVTYNTAATLTANTFSRTGYTFMGWATAPDGEKVYNNSQANVTFTNATTLYAVWQIKSNNVTFTSPVTGATVKVNGNSTSPQSAAYGSTVTIAITPADHYSVSSVTATGATSGALALTGTGDTRTFTMPDEAVTVAVSMTAETQYTATFMNNTTSFATANYYVDDDITAPAGTPTSCDDDEFTFVGWVASQQAEEATTHPEILTFPQTMPTGGVTYYALFRRSEGGSGGSGGEASVTFKTASSDDGTERTSDEAIKENIVDSYTGISTFEGYKLYLGKNGAKLGTGSYAGYITLNLSSPITTDKITVEAVKYGTDAGNIEVEVNGSTNFGTALSPADGTLEFTGDEVEISSLTVSTTSKRAYIASISLGGGESGTNYYTTAPECIPCENQVTITKGAETNGTFTLSLANGSYDNCKKNVSLTVSGITPATDYYCTGVTATGNSNIVSVVGPDGSGNYTVAYAKGYSVNSTVTAHFAPIPTYTVIWSIDGDESMTATYKEGETITFPTSDQVEGCDGKVFRGWSATTVAETDDEPTYTTSATMGTEDVTYYAVFATEETSAGGGSATWSKASSIAKGDKVIFVCEGVSKELSGFSSTSTVYGLGTAYNNNEPAGTYVFDVDDGNSTGTFAFKNGNKYLYWTSGNSLNVNGTLSNNTSWSVSISNGNATVLNVADNARQILWNVSSPRFATYSGQSVGNSYYAIQLYKQSTSGGTTTYSGYTTTCAPCYTKVTLTKGEESHGTFTLNKADGEHNNCASNFVVTVSGITPANGYYCTGVTATGGANVEVSSPDANGNYTVTYTKGNNITSTITANFAPLPTYTVTWSINGDVSNTASYREGQSIDFPTTAEGCDDMTFMGWSATSFGPTEEKPTYVTSAVMGTTPLTYYAVFAEASTSVGEGSSDEYELFSGELTEGNYLIVYDGGAMKNTVSSDRLDYSEVTPENNVITTTDATIIWHIAPSGDYWTIYNAAEEAYAAGTGAKNKAQMLADGTDNKSLWSCSSSASSETYDFVNKANTTNSVNATLRKNGTYGFACYATGTGGALSLYKGAGSGTTYTYTTSCRACATPTVEFASATVNKFDGDAPFTITPTVTGNTMGATLTYKSSNTNKAEVNADGTVTIKDAMSDQPITITATLARVETTEACQNRATASYTLNIYNKVTWLVNGSEYTTGNPTAQTTEGGTIETAPSEPNGDDVCFGKTFVGWTTAEYEEDDAKPEVLYTSSSIVGQHITESTTFYAVFAELTGTLNQYRKGTPSQLATGQKVIIVNTAAKKAMKAENSFKSGCDVTPVGDAFTTEEQTIVWTVEQVDGGGYYFMYDDKYLNASGSSLYLDGDEDAWTVTGAGPYIISSGKYPDYSLEWYSGEFKSYTTGSGDPFNMDLYFKNWTIGAYATTCGLCMPKPEVTSTIIKSDKATITWKAVANATGYEFTCSGGTVKVSGTTATITGLTPLSDYTYSIRAQGGDPYTCFRTTNGSFSTPDCDDMPYDITATPYNVVQAIIRWKAEADTARVVVYKDEACTQIHANIADTVSPCYVSGLEENTRYWFKVFGGASQDCESPVQTFLTQTTAVEIVEWQNDGVIILLTGDETTASVLIEDKQEHIENAGNVADKLFISKYFEADGNNKMIAVYNGTKETIDITNYWLKHSNKGSAETKICLKKFGKTPGHIAPNEEIIIMRFTTSTDPATECAEKEDNYDEWSIVNEGETDGEGNNIYNWLSNIAGPQSVGLYNGTTMIDVIGARTEGGALVQIESSIKQPCAAAIGSNNDAAGFSAKGLERGTEDSIMLSTNRCLLIRKNTVKSGDNAVATNVYSSQEECSSEITKAFKTLSDEWVGYVIGKDNASTRTCEGLAEVGGFDYQGYYASYDTAVVVQDLQQNDDGTITIPIPKLDTMSCTMLRINVYDKNTKEQKASREYRIPIMIQSGEVKSTNELFTKHGVAVCKDCDVLVFNGATLKKDNIGEDRDTIGNLTLYPGSTLELPSGKGDYHVKSLTYRVEGDNVPVTKLSATDHLYTETQSLVVTRRIKNDRYYFISFPYDVNVNEITLANGSKAVNGKDFRLMEYDAEARAAEGSLQGAPGHWKLFTGDKLTAGRGYAIAVNTKAMKEIMFPMTLNSKNLTTEESTKTTNTVDINEYTGAARNTNHNWNLIAHPYITKFEVTSGATNVEAYWENPSRDDTGWIDDWQTWPEDDPTQGTDSTETHTGDILESGTVDNGLVWVLYANATMELTGGGQMVDFSSLEAVPWAQHRQFIKDLKIGGDVQKIGKYAFSQCTNLVTVTIAAPVTNLASYAFAGCTQLRSFRIESTQYISATTTTFDGVSTLSVYVPQSMYDQYRQNSPWNKMALSAFDGSSTTGGDGSNTNPTPRRVVAHPDGWKESPGGIYVTIPVVKDGKVGYDQYWINEVADIKPFTAVFIQGDGQGQMTFGMYPATPAPKRMLQADPCETRDHTVFVGLTIHGNGQMDKTSLRLRPDFSEEYKLNLDLLKFTTFYTSRPQIYFKTENDQLAYRAVSDSLAANTWLPVGVYCRDAGEYTFALYDRYVWDEVEAVYLRDNTTGIETNLLMGNYTITTTGQLYTNTRFAVKVLLRRKVKDTPTMIDHTEDPNAPRKFFRDGLLYIMRDGKVYDLTGKPVQFDDLLNR